MKTTVTAKAWNGVIARVIVAPVPIDDKFGVKIDYSQQLSGGDWFQWGSNVVDKSIVLADTEQGAVDDYIAYIKPACVLMEVLKEN